MSDRGGREGEPLADVEIGVAARAKRLRFDRKPEDDQADHPHGDEQKPVSTAPS